MLTLRKRPVVLAYHGVGSTDEGNDPDRLIVSANHLKEHIHLLRGRGYRFLTAEEALDVATASGLPAATAVLTFDDGFENWLTHAAPLLQELGVPATFFVCGAWDGGQHPEVRGALGRLLDRAGWARLAGMGMELGSHAFTHRDLRTLNDEELTTELIASKQAVEETTGRICRTIAYPFGLFDERVQRAVGRAGYEGAFDWLPGRWDPFAIPRLPGPPRHGARRLSLKLLGLRRPGR
jgi:peptidoglycan/xylan/chitin deacetylase (PgdA/CDA1 family)